MAQPNTMLDDRSSRLIFGTSVWDALTPMLNGQHEIHAAVTYVGEAADELLPMTAPGSIVVNAGDPAIENGSTDPRVLLRWVLAGVEVYSLETLYASVMLVHADPAFVVVGSANVSRDLAGALDEAVVISQHPSTVGDARAALLDCRQRAGSPLTVAWLIQAVERSPYPPEVHPEPAPVRQQAPIIGVAPVTGATPVAAAAPVTEATPVPAAAPQTEATLVTDAPAQPTPEVADSAVIHDAHVPTEEPTVEDVIVDLVEVVTEPEPEPAPAPPTQVARATVRVPWPRPKTVYLAPLIEADDPSLEALYQLDRLETEYGLTGSSHPQPGDYEIEAFYWDEKPHSAGEPNMTYPIGSHVVPIDSPSGRRIPTTAMVSPPGRVLDSYTDHLRQPPRRYFFVLVQVAPTRSFKELRTALATIKEKPEFDHPYFMQHKIETILKLWPSASYDG
jgi:hypothetical protein